MNGKGNPPVEVEGVMERSPGLDAEWDRNRAEEDPVMWELAMTDKAHREQLAKSPPYDVLERKVAEACAEQGVPMMPPEVAERHFSDFVAELERLLDEFGEDAVKRGVKLWLLEQLDDDPYAFVETDDRGRYRDVLDGEVLWDPDEEGDGTAV